ncbi:MAG: DNA-processing protein DprA [Bdellovibrionales bacterium]|nr:DNA-processing protein DprA [Bdellovibrionales bacterium]
MEWKKYFALLSWQKQTVLIDDFQQLNKQYETIQSPEDLYSFSSTPSTRQYLLENKGWWKQAEKHIKVCERQKIQLTWPGQQDYPPLLYYYKNSPVLLSYRGAPAWLKHFQFCVVGSRKIHPSTCQWMDHFLSVFLKKYPLCLLSGGARGVDQKGHALAIRSQTPTVCFLPCGLSNIYPANLKAWEKPILHTGGAFLSPFPPEFQIQKSFFHYRNTIMSKMSHLVFILQAEKRSGSMMTAQKAGHLGVTLCTLPGPVMNPLFAGNLKLINEGTLMIRDDQDLETLYQAQTLFHQSADNSTNLPLVNLL